MIKLTKSVLSFIMCIGLCTTPTVANEEEQVVEPTFSASITNSLTKEVQTVEVEQISSQKRSSNGNVEASYKAHFPIPIQNGLQRDFQSGGKVEAGIDVRLKVTYQMSGRKIKVQSFEGSWTPQSSLYILSNRMARLTISYSPKYTNEYKLSRNSFYFSTTWGYVDKPAQNDWFGVKSTMGADVKVDGMGSMVHHLRLDVNL